MEDHLTLIGRTVASDTPLRVEVSGGSISSVSPASLQECEPDLYFSVGLLDIQVNGYRRRDYSGETLETRHVGEMVDMLARAGTTRHFPTVITGDPAVTLRNLEMIAGAAGDDDDLRSAIPGIHMEGPFISREDGPRGVHDPAFVRHPDFSEFREWQSAAGGLIRLVTVAPEQPGAIDFIRRVADEGVVVSIGHHAADTETIEQAVTAGAVMVTHLGNGSHAVLPRLHNYIWEQLANDNLMASIIADGFHLPPPVMKVFVRAKGTASVILVSDVGFLGGLPPGRGKWGPVDVEIHEDGHLGIPGTRFLAGAGHLLDRGVGQAVLHTDMTLADAVRSCTVIPAGLFGLEHEPEPAAGRIPQNFVAFRWRPGDEALRCVLTTFRGRVWKGEE